MVKLNESTLLMDGGGFRYDISCWDPTVHLFEMSTPEEREEFRIAARSMPYKKYIRTTYWGVIRGKMLSTCRSCANCKSRSRLQVHHITYIHRGEEYAFLEDLEVVCGICHKGKHELATVDEILLAEGLRLNARNRTYDELDGGNTLRSPLPFIAGILEDMIAKYDKGGPRL